jgi:hypothetical protein
MPRLSAQDDTLGASRQSTTGRDRDDLQLPRSPSNRHRGRLLAPCSLRHNRPRRFTPLFLSARLEQAHVLNAHPGRGRYRNRDNRLRSDVGGPAGCGFGPRGRWHWAAGPARRQMAAISLHYSAHPCFSSSAMSFASCLAWRFRHIGWPSRGRGRLRSW